MGPQSRSKARWHPARACLAVATLAAAGCAPGEDDQEPGGTTPPTNDGTSPGGEVTLTYDFEAGSEGWSSDIADYTEDTRPDDLLSETEATPPGLPDAEGSTFHLAATNYPDDLFLYLRRQVGPDDGLQADTTYEASFVVRFASDAPSGCAGIGGAPGESVYLKVGASPQEPVPVDEDGQVRLSVDKGGGSQGGEAADVAGNVANGIPCEEALEQDEQPYAMVTLEETLDSPVTTTDDGTLWLFVGTDSGFEGRTSIYYDRIEVTLTPQQ